MMDAMPAVGNRQARTSSSRCVRTPRGDEFPRRGFSPSAIVGGGSRGLPSEPLSGRCIGDNLRTRAAAVLISCNRRARTSSPSRPAPDSHPQSGGVDAPPTSVRAARKAKAGNTGGPRGRSKASLRLRSFHWPQRRSGRVSAAALSALSDNPPECHLTDWRSRCAKLDWEQGRLLPSTDRHQPPADLS